MTEHEHGALGGALTAMREGDGARALRLLIKQWRKTPHPTLSRLIQELGTELAPKRKSVASQRPFYREERWKKVHGAGRPEDLDYLLTGLPVLTAPALHAVVPLLAERAPDPRLERFLLDCVRDPQREQLVLSLAPHISFEEPQHVQELQSILQKAPLSEKLRRALEHCLGRSEAPAPLPQELEPTLEALAAGSWSESSANLFTQIYATPEDDAPRAILADALQEADDPRGEFIQLQLGPSTPTSASRQAELLSQHRSQWLGPFAPVVVPEKTRFRRGLICDVTLAEITVDQRRALTGRPEWSTVESVTFSRYSGHAAKMIAHSPMRSLRALHGVEPNNLLRPRMARLRELTLLMVHVQKLPTTPKLQSLTMLNPISLKTITDWRGEAPELRSVHLHVPRNNANEFTDWALHEAQLERVSLDLGWKARLILKGSDLTLIREGQDGYNLFRLRSALINSTKVRRVHLIGLSAAAMRAQLEACFGEGVQIEEVVATS